MRELKVLKLTDVQASVKGYEEIISKQLELFLEENGVQNISETPFFITKKNIIVDIRNDINEENFQKTIEAGAEMKTMFFLRVENFEKCIYGWINYERIKKDKEYGVLLDSKEDAEEYKRAYGEEKRAEDVKKIIKKELEKQEKKYQESKKTVVETGYFKTNNDDFQRLIIAEIDSFSWEEEVKKRIEAELGMKVVKIEDYGAVSKRLLQKDYIDIIDDYNDYMYRWHHCRRFYEIKIKGNRKYIVFILYTVCFNPIYVGVEEVEAEGYEDDRKDYRYFTDPLTGKNIKKEVHSELEVLVNSIYVKERKRICTCRGKKK
ncbi:hypothetical protein KQI41_17455 [Tissierella pigra]|uniref:hypothetical protein n=1 Tax=Tissierella pigra TaxID=2607614 RepID=UPI001C0FD457|nr:hypothetical protein [Tissierella pigra]MBU5428184.1 hypothetical protein [Tissierella pigra]